MKEWPFLHSCHSFIPAFYSNRWVRDSWVSGFLLALPRVGILVLRFLRVHIELFFWELSFILCTFYFYDLRHFSKMITCIRWIHVLLLRHVIFSVINRKSQSQAGLSLSRESLATCIILTQHQQQRINGCWERKRSLQTAGHVHSQNLVVTGY